MNLSGYFVKFIFSFIILLRNTTKILNFFLKLIKRTVFLVGQITFLGSLNSHKFLDKKTHICY